MSGARPAGPAAVALPDVEVLVPVLDGAVAGLHLRRLVGEAPVGHKGERSADPTVALQVVGSAA